MDKEHLILNESELPYEQILQMKEHSKQYEFATDKIEFLKNISAYEQKLILLQSERPYEVLEYLSQLDLKTSKIVLSELKYDELYEIIRLFTLEDKKRFYNTFSDLSLVNRFIACDKNADNFIDDLTTDRKVNLLNSSDKKTVEATAKIYESIPEEERVMVASKVNTIEGSIALDSSTSYNEDVILSESIEESGENDIQSNQQDLEEANQEVIDNEQLAEPNEQNKLQVSQELMIFFSTRLQYYKENIPGFENIDINNPEVYESLSPELKAIVDKDFEQFTQKQEKQTEPEMLEVDPATQNTSGNEISKLDLFTEAKKQNEQELISELSSQLQISEVENEQTKIL